VNLFWLPLNASLVDREALLALDGYDPRLRWHADWFATYTPGAAPWLRGGAGAAFGVSRRGRFVFRNRHARPATAAASLRRIYEKLSEPEFADIHDAMRQYPVAFSTFMRPLVQVLVRRPREWRYLLSLLRWWLKEVSHGRRPGLLRDLTAPFRAPPYSKKIQP